MRRALAIAVVAGLALLACSGVKVDDGTEATSTTALRPPAPTTTAPIELAAGQVLHHIGTTFQYGAFLVTIGDAVYDKAEGTLFIGARFRNLSSQWAQPETAAALTTGGTEYPLFGVVVDVPPARSADVTITVESLPADPAPAGTIAWGRPDRDQPVIALAGNGAGKNLFRPTPLAVDTWAAIGKYGVHVTGAEVLAGALDLNLQADPGQRFLRLTFDEFAARLDPVNGFYPVEHLTLVRPDGETVEGTESSEGFATLSWTAAGGNWIEFPIPADPAGRYELLLSSLSPKGFSTLHPELVERVSAPFRLGALQVAKAVADPTTPRPTLTSLTEVTPGAKAVDVPLDAGVLNVPGFTFTPERLQWDPAAANATVTGTAKYIQTESDDTTGILDTDPQFSFTTLLASGGQFTNCAPDEPPTVPRGRPVEVVLQCPSTYALDPNAVGLLMGPRSTQASSIPLGPKSPVPAYPPAPIDAKITAPKVTAGDWTVQLVSYRVGLLQSAVFATPGRRQLEVRMKITASPSARVSALGLSFTSGKQVFLAGADGYLTQPVADSGLVSYEPGATHEQSVTFSVPDSFTGGDIALVLRSNSEVGEIGFDRFTETTFVAHLAQVGAAKTQGGL